MAAAVLLLLSTVGLLIKSSFAVFPPYFPRIPRVPRLRRRTTAQPWRYTKDAQISDYSTCGKKFTAHCLKKITAYVWKKLQHMFEKKLQKITAHVWKNLQHIFENIYGTCLKNIYSICFKKKLQHMSENILRIYFKINLQHMSGKKNLQHMSEKFTHACPFRGSVQNWHESGIKTFWFRHESGNFWIRNLKWKPTNPNSPVV